MRPRSHAATAARSLAFGAWLAVVASNTTGSAQPVERTVLDATILAVPPRIGAPCMQIGAGGLTVRARSIPQSRPLPTTLLLWGYRDGVVAMGTSIALGPDEVSATLPPSADAWCWSIEIETPPDVANAGEVERSTHAQLVSLTITTSSP